MAMQGPLQAMIAKMGGGGAQGAPSQMPPNAASLGTGAPPDLSGGLPPPTGTGAMPTGNSNSVDKKSAIDQAVLQLRDVMGHVPNLQSQVQQMIDALKNEVAPKPGQPGPDVASGTGPGASASPTDPLQGSGSPGAM